MKRIGGLVIILCLCISFPGYSKDIKIGYADIIKLFNNYKKTKDYEKILDEKKKNKEKENKLEEKRSEIIKMRDKLELLKDKEKAQQEEKIKIAIREYRTLESQIVADLKKESDEKISEIIGDINNTISRYAEKNRFDLIFNRSAVLYGSEGIDITDIILKKLNEGYKAK